MPTTPLDLYKSLGEDGGVAGFVPGMLSLQLVIHRDRFPDGYGAESRISVVENIWDPVIKRIRQADEEKPDRDWAPISGEHEKKYRSMLLDIRQQLRSKGLYHHGIQRLLKTIRCKSDSSLAECNRDTEGGSIN